jgi:hypothetical protein
MQSPISKFSLDRKFTKEEKGIFVNFVKNTHKIEASLGNAKTKSMSILDMSELVDIKSFCLSSLNKYTNSSDFYITESWLNFIMPSEWHHSHNHPNSLISGILYVNARKALHTVVFSELEETISVEKFDLLLFPSYLLHHTSKSKDSDLKISLSFNTSKITT